MDQRRHHRNKKSQRPRAIVKATAEKKEIASIESFREEYLPNDERRRASLHMTPQEIGQEFARRSLTAAKQVLSERKPAHRKSAAV